MYIKDCQNEMSNIRQIGVLNCVLAESEWMYYLQNDKSKVEF